MPETLGSIPGSGAWGIPKAVTATQLSGLYAAVTWEPLKERQSWFSSLESPLQEDPVGERPLNPKNPGA